MDQVLIQDLLIRGVIGVTERERENPQDILVNMVIYTDIRKAGQTDNVDHSVNYRTVAKKVFAFVEKSVRYTVEALATDIARIVLEEPGVEGVRIRVEKPGAVRFSRSVGVEIERWREEERKRPHEAFLLLGSNIEPEKNLPAAIARLHHCCQILGTSSIWETEPVGSSGANFLNAAMWVETDEDVDSLKSNFLRKIEEEFGRVRTEDKYAPRTIDLDVVIYDQEVLDPRLWELAFLAVPIAELYPNLRNSESHQTLREVARILRDGPGVQLRQDIAW